MKIGSACQFSTELFISSRYTEGSRCQLKSTQPYNISNSNNQASQRRCVKKIYEFIGLRFLDTKDIKWYVLWIWLAYTWCRRGPFGFWAPINPFSEQRGICDVIHSWLIIDQIDWRERDDIVISQSQVRCGLDDSSECGAYLQYYEFDRVSR